MMTHGRPTPRLASDGADGLASPTRVSRTTPQLHGLVQETDRRACPPPQTGSAGEDWSATIRRRRV
jgi:hypothetical protein